MSKLIALENYGDAFCVWREDMDEFKKLCDAHGFAYDYAPEPLFAEFANLVSVVPEARQLWSARLEELSRERYRKQMLQYFTDAEIDEQIERGCHIPDW